MSEALDSPQASGPPQAFFPEVGDSIVVGIVDVGEYQQKDYDTGEMKFWPNGGKVMGKVVTGMVVSLTGSTGAGGVKSGTHEIAPGDLVSFWCEGGKFFTYRDAVNAHGTVSVGDVMFWRRDEDEPPKKRGHDPRKVYTAKIRKPESKDGDLVERCGAKRRELKSQPVDAPRQIDPVYGDEVPF